MSSFYWKAGCVFGLTGIGLGAFGSHGLAKVVGDNPAKLKSWSVATQYQMMQSVALLALSSIPSSVRRIHPAAQPMILGGTVMFSGSIYLLTLQREKFKALGPVTPLGGLVLMAGWAALLL
ncbi:hypothetical protein G6F57_000827 [Rhizopus arrhizus]|uniref:DUF423-domain-containing protein n=1 Tax=Rhizopus oryzae TaxID=64495 RepID=A0A9P6X9G8_RHIOR|nr:hypothetical protein G6F23_008062 [Rhizopus arrhizus]KAG1423701.1 hypothetical protein G6F58_002715 [Rhizopus delemar]KAG0769317.1 hypothetical protein G6F24_001174 [Rhizopus arrhizus]KAG0791885.1 hypothetical protein G6F22_006016 [Rhizopus arrhizus]KAG0796197.1 hypothetical protein G6F21_001503 [Rhizopus arrhizus]